MQVFIHIAALLATSLALASESGRWSCGAPAPDDAFIALSTELSAIEQEKVASGDIFNANKNKMTETWVHIVAAGEDPAQGNVPDATVYATIDRMNEVYADLGVHFNLAGITRQTAPQLSVWPSTDLEALAYQLGKAYRKGTYTTLNLYIVLDLPGTYLGACAYPSQYPSGYKSDGCFFQSNLLPTFPGQTGPHGGLLGGVVIHEVGHWFGLRHTFSSKTECIDGDEMYDTPIHLQPSGYYEQDCGGEQSDTCPGDWGQLLGKDPWHNYMNYVHPECMSGVFTFDQAMRIQTWWDYRAVVG